ncbi:hypothetical protein [Rhodoflexus sp.]
MPRLALIISNQNYNFQSLQANSGKAIRTFDVMQKYFLFRYQIFSFGQLPFLGGKPQKTGGKR